MTPNVYATLISVTGITNIVSDRIYRTIAPQGDTQPCIVWSLASNVPNLSLDCTPEVDDQRIQIDCYSLSQPQCRQLATLVRDTIEAETHIVFGPWDAYESDTRLWRWSMDAEYWHSR